jgi:hypothetical protein
MDDTAIAADWDLHYLRLFRRPLHIAAGLIGATFFIA